MSSHANHSRQHQENPSVGGAYGDGGNRTRATFPADPDPSATLAAVPGDQRHCDGLLEREQAIATIGPVAA